MHSPRSKIKYIHIETNLNRSTLDFQEMNEHELRGVIITFHGANLAFHSGICIQLVLTSDSSMYLIPYNSVLLNFICTPSIWTKYFVRLCIRYGVLMSFNEANVEL